MSVCSFSFHILSSFNKTRQIRSIFFPFSIWLPFSARNFFLSVCRCWRHRTSFNHGRDYYSAEDSIVRWTFDFQGIRSPSSVFGTTTGQSNVKRNEKLLLADARTNGEFELKKKKCWKLWMMWESRQCSRIKSNEWYCNDIPNINWKSHQSIIRWTDLITSSPQRKWEIFHHFSNDFSLLVAFALLTFAAN